MINDQQNDLSCSQNSEDIQQSFLWHKQEDYQQQHSSSFVEDGTTYVKLYSIHAKAMTNKKFPFHLYLKQRYRKLSFQKQICIFQNYFKCFQNQENQIKIQTSDIQILNEGLNLFTKIPKNAMVFLVIENYNQNKQIMTLKNYNGEILHFQISDKNRKRLTSIMQIRRKLHGKPFMIIQDKSKFQMNTNTTNVNLNMLCNKTLIKMGMKINYIYFKKYTDPKQAQIIKKQYFSQQNNNKKKDLNTQKDLKMNCQLYIRNIEYSDKIKITLGLDCSGNLFIFCKQSNQDQDYGRIENILKLKNQLYQHIQYMTKQQQQIILSNTQTRKLGVRLRIFDYLFINFLKVSGKNRSQFIRIVGKMSRKIQNNVDDIDQEYDHFPDKLLSSKRCKNCEILGDDKNKKSNYKCLACSKKYQVDIALCIDCFGQFHEQVLPKCGRASVRKMKKAYQSYFQKSNWSVQSCSQGSSQAQKNYNIQKTVCKLDQNIQQIEKLMNELEQTSPSNIEIVKKCNQYLLTNIIESFNQIMKNNPDFRRSFHSSLFENKQHYNIINLSRN